LAVRKKTGGLGRGLDALIAPQVSAESPDAEPEKKKKAVKSSRSEKSTGVDNVKVVEKIVEVPVEKIVEKIVEVPAENSSELTIKIDEIEPNANQPRKDFNEEALQELAESIKLHGVIQPLVVVKENGYYRIIAGERRWRAARLAGLTEIPVVVKNYSAQESIEIALIENIQREDLNPIEEAEAFQRLIDEYGLMQEEAAEKVSKSRTAVTNSLRLLKLDPRVKQMLTENMITGGHGRALLAISDPEQQYVLAMKIFDNKLSVRETERLIKNIQKAGGRETAKPDPQVKAVYHDIEERITSVIGSKVSINPRNKKKGLIEIEYYSQDDLERIVSLLTSVK